jgi:long-chain acyl-CoA synthetase
VTFNTYEQHRFASVGKVMRDIQAMITPDGEIVVKGPNVFKGYYKNEEKTRETFTSDGWFKTGDMGEFDRDGFLFLRGRRKYMILSAGGQNVFPEDIEDALNACAGVKDSAVLGIEHVHGAVAIHAVLLLEPGASAPEILVQQANSKLASYQQITDWTVWPEVDFPRSATRKVRKELVRAYLQSRVAQTGPIATTSPLIRLLSSVSGVALHAIGPTSTLVRNLHLDSLKRIELLARIE